MRLNITKEEFCNYKNRWNHYPQIQTEKSPEKIEEKEDNNWEGYYEDDMENKRKNKKIN